MLKSDQLKQLRAKKAEEAQAILDVAEKEARKLTADESAKVKVLTDEVTAFGPQIDTQITLENALKDKPAAPVVNPLAKDDDKKPLIQVLHRRHNLHAFQAGANRSFDTRPQAEEAAFRSGRWLQALFGDAKARQYCQDHGVFSAGTKEVIYNVHEEGVQSTGGALVPDEFEAGIIDLREQYGVFRRLAKVVTMVSDYKVKARRTGGLTAYPLAESQSFTESTKGWDSVALTAKLWGVLAKYSMSLGEDSAINIADDLAQESAYAFAVAEDDAGFNGTGASTYGGIVGVLQKFIAFVDASGSGAVNPATATHNLFSEIDGDDIDNVVAALPQYADGNARFICSRLAKSLVFDPLLRAGGGNNKSDIAGRMLNTYLGYPIEIAQKMPAGAATDYQNLPMLLFGDFAAAVTFGDRRGVTVKVLNELYAANGQVGVIASERFDINVHDIGTSSAAGPLVALIGSSS